MINSMYTYTKILYVKRATYIEVFVYYSRKEGEIPSYNRC